ncbi:hypothetical protein M6G65_06650 [Methylobacterium tardum]|uniref:Uncharacterized protein n=1 Tax=Methylobacterium tardum TaxID=374432 RepID=A0AA37TGS7_9HYPH|nr:hypothetical protein [Methylobacterium tardum]URD38141.1 hypothetical protein M6G65_06650 [Methylobacterium tardum]GLS71737.1 hypothetical protein GCM10007890_37500 [Methylobacterium tardum]
MSKNLPQGQATFRGRGLAFVHGTRIVVKVCPHCSQWNAPKAADRGVCGWCAYVPSYEDLVPVTPRDDPREMFAFRGHLTLD